jgi:uncharacterized protein (DUF2147 family)
VAFARALFGVWNGWVKGSEETMKIRTVILVAAITVSGPAMALADPIEGTWLRPSTGTLVRYEKTGDQYCGTVLSGEYEGQSIGCLENAGNGYKGKVIALDEGKTYAGKATINGDTMKLSGCIAGFLCKGEDWQRQ